MEYNRLGKRVQKLKSLPLAFLLVAVSLGMGLGVQPATAATWNTVNPGFSESFANKIAYGNGTWLLFSHSRDFGKSTDGTTFERHSSSTVFPCEVNKAMHVGTQWIAGCSNGKVYTLADGLDPVDVTKWVERTTGKSGKLVSIATDGDTIVVVGDSGGTMLTSVDGHNWVDRSISGAAGFNDVTYGQGKFLAVGRASDNSSAIYASDDGETWNKVTTATPSKQLYGIAYGGAKFVAVGLEGYLYVSDDGESWVEKTPPADTQSISFITVSYGAGQFYVGGTSQTILTSLDGSTFTTETSGGSTKSVTSIAVANGKAIAVGTSGLVLSAAPLSSNASLSSLLITPTPNSVISDPATNIFTVEVPYGTSSVIVTPTLDDPTATMTVNGTSRANDEATTVTLDTDGSTDITIVVKAQDGVTTKTYTITVNEAAPSSNGYLSSLSVNGIPVPGFVKEDYSYSVEVPLGTGNAHVRWTLDGSSTLHALRVEGTEMDLGSPPISGVSWFLTPGVARVFEIDVKAQTGTITTYTLSVTEKETLVNKADLQAKVTEINNENLVEADYTPVSWNALQNALKEANDVLADPDAIQDEVDAALTSLNKARQGLKKQEVAPPVWPSGSELTVSDIKQTSVKLSWPAAQDNFAVRGYRLYVNGEKKMDKVDSEFDYSVTDSVYSYSLAGLTPGTAYHFTVKAYDTAGNEGEPGLTASAKTLPRSSSGGSHAGGDSGGDDTLAGNTNLKRLEVWINGQRLPLLPSFTPANFSYTAKTEANQIELKASVEDSAARVTWQGQTLENGVTIDLQEGENVITLIVQAENGSRQTYTLTIERRSPQAVDQDLPLISFSDIVNHWAENYIQHAATKGIVSGYPDGTFKPNHPVTRAEFTVMLIEALQLKGTGAALTFTDTAQIGAWAKQSAARAVQSGIITGYADGSFRPDAQITRAEMAVMIARAMQLPMESGASTVFADDADIPHWARGAVEAIRKLGVVNGRGDNRFVPHDTATRAEATVMLLRLLEQQQKPVDSSYDF